MDAANIPDSEPERQAYRQDREARKELKRKSSAALGSANASVHSRAPWDTIQSALSLLEEHHSSPPAVESANDASPLTAFRASLQDFALSREKVNPAGLSEGKKASMFSQTSVPKAAGPVSKPRPALTRGSSSATAGLAQRVPAAALPAELVAVLLSCPICDIEWTARKTTPNKHSHVLKCAKGRLLTPEDLLVEVAKAARRICQSTGSVTGKQQTAFAQVVTGSLAEVDDVQVADGCSQATQLREDLRAGQRAARKRALGRDRVDDGQQAIAAKMLLDDPALAAIPATPLRSTANQLHPPPRDNASDDQMPAATPAFAASRLQRAHSRPNRRPPLWNVPQGAVTSSNADTAFDVGLWEKALRYEPLPFSEATQLLQKTDGKPIKQDLARQMLETEGIVTWTPQSRAPKRGRY